MKNYATTVFFMVCMLCLTCTLHAQVRVTGTVKDAVTGETLPGANVVIEDTTTGVITDINGNFTINVPRPNTVLQVSFIGYTMQRIPLQGVTALNVELYPDVTALQEVVVVGYGTVEARKVAGSISSISADDINKINTTSMDLALQGRAAGLQISSTSGEANTEVRIRIRGSNSISGDNEPLIVLDGFPLFTDPGVSPLSFVNMDDVASIEVLKDASATAIYGSRGANGVLLITTKQGTVGRPRIDFTAETFINEKPKYPQMMSGPQYIEFGNSYNRWDTPLSTDTITTDWLDRVLQTAYGQNYTLNINGGTRDNRYLVSGSYFANEGVILDSGFDRATLRANLNNRLNDKMTLTTNLNYNFTRSLYSNGPSGEPNSTSIVFTALRSLPYKPAGDSMEDEDPFSNDYINVPNNPILNITEMSDVADRETFMANMTFDYNILPGLKLTARGGTNLSLQNRDRYWGRKTGPGYRFNGRAFLVNSKSNNYLIEGFGTYEKALNLHNLNLVLGASYQQNISKSASTIVNGFLSDGLGVYGMGSGLEPASYPYNRADREIQSYFFRVNYDFNSKYIFTASGRVDGSSVFAANNKYAFFPAAAIAWRVNEEAFMENIDFISELRLRAGYGETGNQAIRPYESISQFGFSNYLIGDAEISGVFPSVMGNVNLRWETTEQFNTGMDLKVMQGRIGLTVDYYKKTTRDLLLPFQLPSSAGYSYITTNRGELENKGIEITLSGDIVRTRDFGWSSNLNYSRNRSKVLDLGGLDFIPGPKIDNNFLNENLSGQFVGEPFSVFVGYHHTGLIQYHDFDVNGNPLFSALSSMTTVGFQKWEDMNHDGIVNAEDRTFLGDPNPKFYFGFNNDFYYKRLSLNVFIQGQYGNKIFNVTPNYISTGYRPYNNTLEWWENRWTTENQHNDPRYPYQNAQNLFRPTNTYVEDGSYARLKNVSLRYDIPFKASQAIRNIQIYVSGTNLITITNYSGIDPEVNLFGNRDDAIGVDFFAYPQTRTFTLGVKLGV
jgi:TonB-dependent starch-binding outer membrane protein SusC